MITLLKIKIKKYNEHLLLASIDSCNLFVGKLYMDVYYIKQ